MFSFQHPEEFKDPIEYMCQTLEEGGIPFFQDYQSYLFLFKNNVIIPGETVLRIDNGGTGGNYLALSIKIAQGMNANAYAGLPGNHSIKKLIDKIQYWSLDGFYLPQLPKGTMAPREIGSRFNAR